MRAPALARLLSLALGAAAAACAGHARPPAGPAAAAGPADPLATPEVRALFASLKRLEGHAVLFGHHDDLAYGHGWFDQPGRSDVKETAGAYPAVYGWEVGNVEKGLPRELDGVEFARMSSFIAEGYRRGAVITMSWHMSNPASGGNAWDTTAAVATVLPGGAHHETYVQWLDRFADFVGTLRSADGTPIPIVFRPFHEMSGSWFWWGGRHRTPDEYRRLWRFTVDHLRRRGVHNLLYAYAPDVFDSPAAYLAQYPGDAYVDVLGFDDYQSVRSPATRDVLVRRLHDVVALADARGKIPALTETGVEGIPDALWWTGTLLPAIAHDSLTRRIAWVSVWRNAPVSATLPHHFYAPYAGQASADDFARFHRDSLIVFDDRLPPLYRLPAAP